MFPGSGTLIGGKCHPDPLGSCRSCARSPFWSCCNLPFSAFSSWLNSMGWYSPCNHFCLGIMPYSLWLGKLVWGILCLQAEFKLLSAALRYSPLSVMYSAFVKSSWFSLPGYDIIISESEKSPLVPGLYFVESMTSLALMYRVVTAAHSRVP